ncbi:MULTISPECIES: hypothetical protein [Peribacillus]|uniref:GntT/GntP/DsdX family permease n=1 Tax=Peribacillus TaxID=2675229 RepID=UPI003338EAAD
MIGKPIIALMISVVVSFFTLGCARGFNKEEINQFMPAAPSQLRPSSSLPRGAVHLKW